MALLPNIERLCKWRTVFAGWQLGTRPVDDPECAAVKDHREATLIQRCELSALATLLLSKGIITKEEWIAAVEKEADLLAMALEGRFPGFRAVDEGMIMDGRAVETLKGWKP